MSHWQDRKTMEKTLSPGAFAKSEDSYCINMLLERPFHDAESAQFASPPPPAYVATTFRFSSYRPIIIVMYVERGRMCVPEIGYRHS